VFTLAGGVERHLLSLSKLQIENLLAGCPGVQVAQEEVSLVIGPHHCHIATFLLI